MRGRIYKTKEEAERALFEWKLDQYKLIGERGDKILSDTSFVLKSPIYAESDWLWTYWKAITTQAQIDDLYAELGIDHVLQVEEKLIEELKSRES